MTAMRPVFYSDLLPSERRLVTAMQRLRFGRFARLAIQGGEAVLLPWPVTVRGIKFGDNVANQVQGLTKDARLPSQVSELLAYIRGIGSGEILTLEFRHALPFRMEIGVSGESEESVGVLHAESEMPGGKTNDR